MYSNPVNFTDPSGNFPAECLESPNFAQCLRDWLRDIKDECSSHLGNLQFIGNFNLSAYYTPIYEEGTWFGKNILAETDPGNTSAIGNGAYLASGGGYTGDKKWALSASEGFLGHGDGICTQGTGIIQGMVIFCSTPPGADVKFTWGAHRGNREEGLAGLVAYKTVAMCGSSTTLLNKDDTIYVDAPWYNTILGDNNPDKELKITDTGNKIGSLCRGNPPVVPNEGLDLYLGEGKDAFKAWNDFNVADNERGRAKYWPVYRVIK